MLKDNLVVLRNCKGISQEQISEIIGISRQAYAKWEKGDTVPDIEKCGLLAEYYGITIDDLVHFESRQLGMVIPPGPKGKHICGTSIINERGQIVIPKTAREFLNIEKGDSFIILVDELEGIALVKTKTFEEKMKQIQSSAYKEIKE